MDTFDIFKKISSSSSTEEKETENDTQPLCNHDVVVTVRGISLCELCGTEVCGKNVDTDEWKYYGISDNKGTTDRNNCYIRKQKDKTIYPDLMNVDIDTRIKDIANDIYVDVCNGKVHRGGRRKAIVFAAVFHAYKIDNNPQSWEQLIQLFNIKRKDALKGLKFINDNVSKNSPIRELYITPEHLINEYLLKFKVAPEKKNEILSIYHSVVNKSMMLNRSRPQSVASGVIWYWTRINRKTLSIREFTKKVNLSELTINKIAKEISRIKGDGVFV